MARLSKEARERLEAFKAVKVRHPHIKAVDVDLSQAIEEHAGYSHLLLIGPGGVGKTTVVKLVSEQFFKEESDRARVPVVVVKARPGDDGTYTRLDYYRQVLDQLREQAAVKDRLMNRTLERQRRGESRRPSPAEWLDLREDVEYALERLGVKAVFIDEAQLLMQVQPPLKPIDQLNWLRSMTDWTNILYVKYNLNGCRRLMTLTSDSCGRMKKAELFIASVHEELSYGRDSLGVLPAGRTT
jgi:DNA polymerase III delta prime subunit